jgi:hypothetical protein
VAWNSLSILAPGKANKRQVPSPYEHNNMVSHDDDEDDDDDEVLVVLEVVGVDTLGGGGRLTPSGMG